MAGLEPLIPLIYHEKQQPESMLCAQHALNNLLQGPYFTAPDLSQIAENLDVLERSYHEGRGQTSTNMDDTGFFSVQVLENALAVWGLTLMRWRSEAMRPYHDRPYTQLAFILNLQQHWYTLRRFGPASPRMDQDLGDGHWFNLNSFLPAPEWVSKTYLGMVLQQAEAEGYSVFAVAQHDPLAPLALPRTPADDVAATLPEPTGASRTYGSAQTASSSSKPGVQGYEDEDMELQAALQASLGNGSADELMIPESLRGVAGPSISTSGVRTSLQRPPAQSSLFTGQQGDDTERVHSAVEESDDPVAASMARNRALMERMRREQEMALREAYQDEVAEFEERLRRGEPMPGRRRPGEDDDELMRRAIEESLAMAEASGHKPDEEDERMDVDQPAPAPHASSSTQPSWAAPSHRVYDDEDAELQAALRASLESMPEGFQVPEEQPVPPRMPTQPLPQTSSQPEPTSSQSDPSAIQNTSGKEREGYETESEAESEAGEPPKEEELSMEEIRRRRLARFGA